MASSDKKYPSGWIPKEGLENLKNYKYSGNDLSICSKLFMQKYWTGCLQFVPVWMAPNLITLIGFIMNLAAIVILYYYSPTPADTPPKWVCWVAAVCLFAYQTLDALDGKQARRTLSSSPLGELFDHGCDALTTTPVALNTVLCLGDPDGWFNFILVFYTIFGLYFTQFEQYTTGTLTLGRINATVEGILMAVIFFGISGTYGPDIWQTTLFSVGGVDVSPFRLISVGTMLIGLSPFGGLWGYLTNVLAYKNPKVPVPHRLGHSVFFVALCGSVLYSTIIHPDLLNEYFLLHMFTFGITTANLLTRLCISRICGLLYSWQYAALYVVPLIGIQLFSPTVETLARYTFFYALIMGALYLYLAVAICDQMGKYLKINVFKLGPRK